LAFAFSFSAALDDLKPYENYYDLNWFH